MSPDILLLIGTAIIIGFVHTLTGPDHYLPFVVMGRAKHWTVSKTLWLTVWCGIGHVGSSIVLGLIGVVFGIGLHHLTWFESARGNLAAWAFLSFGMVYFVYGMVQAYRNRPHSHIHLHDDGEAHLHTHTHQQEHVHVHEEAKKRNLTPWILFVVFILGPCEPLIPILMYPAAQQSYWGLFLVALSFSVVTIATMTTIVYFALKGVQFFNVQFMERYMHAMAGATISICGFAILFLGL